MVFEIFNFLNLAWLPFCETTKKPKCRHNSFTTVLPESVLGILNIERADEGRFLRLPLFVGRFRLVFEVELYCFFEVALCVFNSFSLTYNTKLNTPCDVPLALLGDDCCETVGHINTLYQINLCLRRSSTIPLPVSKNTKVFLDFFVGASKLAPLRGVGNGRTCLMAGLIS